MPHGPASSSARATTSGRPRDLVAPCLVGGAAGWGLTAAGAGAVPLADAYGVDLVTIGLLTTVIAVPYAALQLPAGLLVDRIGARRTAAGGLLLVVLAYLVAAATPVLTTAFAARIVAGAGSAVGFVAGADLTRRAGAGLVGLGVFGGAAIGAGGVAVAVVPAVDPLLGWRSAWLTCAGVAVAALLATWFLVPAGRGPVERGTGAPEKQVESHGGARGPGSAEPARPAVRREASRPSVLRDGELYRLAAVHATTLGLGLVLGNWAAVVLEERWGLPPSAAAAIASLVLVMTIVSRPLGGYLAQQHPGRVRGIVVLSLVVCALDTAALAVPTTTWLLVVVVVTLGVASGLPFAAVLSAAQRLRPDRPGTAVGLLNAVANSIVVVGAPLLAAAIEQGRTGAALLVIAAVWLVPLVALPRSLRPVRPGR